MRFYKMLLALILSTNLANAYDTTIIYNEDKPIFKLDFYNKGENTVFWWNCCLFLYFKWDSTQFWANIIGASAINSSPIPISVSTFDIPNANALSYDFFSNPIFNRVLQGESIDTIRQELIGVSEDFFTKASVEYLGHINMGKLDWYIAFSSYYPT